MADAGNTGNELATTGKAMGGNGAPAGRTCGFGLSTILRHSALLILIVLSLAYVAGGRYLLQRQMWMDEVHSWLLIKEPDPERSLRALADGVDFNPPTYLVLARQLQYLPGGVTELGLRWFSLSLMLLAMVGVFVVLHRRFPLLICIAATLMMVSNVHLVHQSAEIRFYPLWCAACAWLCVVLDVRTHQPAYWQRINNMAAVLLAGMITTTHYFGILSLGLICRGAMLVPELSRSRRWLIVLTALTGILCLAGCFPFLIGQRAALTRATWVSPATVDDSVGFLTAMFPLKLELEAAVNAMEERATTMLSLPGGLADIRRQIERINGTVDDREARELGKKVLVCTEELFRTRAPGARERSLALLDALRSHLRGLTGRRSE